MHTFIYVISVRQRGSEAGRRSLSAAAGCVLASVHIKKSVFARKMRVHTCFKSIHIGVHNLSAAAGFRARQRDCVLYMQYIKSGLLYAYIGVHFFIYTAGCCPLVMCIYIGVHFFKEK